MRFSLDGSPGLQVIGVGPVTNRAVLVGMAVLSRPFGEWLDCMAELLCMCAARPAVGPYLLVAALLEGGAVRPVADPAIGRVLPYNP